MLAMSFAGSIPTLASSIPASAAADWRPAIGDRTSRTSEEIDRLGSVDSSSCPPGSKVKIESLGNAKYGAPLDDLSSRQPSDPACARMNDNVHRRSSLATSSGHGRRLP